MLGWMLGQTDLPPAVQATALSRFSVEMGSLVHQSDTVTSAPPPGAPLVWRDILPLCQFDHVNRRSVAALPTRPAFANDSTPQITDVAHAARFFRRSDFIQGIV
jgi:hypothetical protein